MSNQAFHCPGGQYVRQQHQRKLPIEYTTSTVEDRGLEKNGGLSARSTYTDISARDLGTFSEKVAEWLQPGDKFEIKAK